MSSEFRRQYPRCLRPSWYARSPGHSIRIPTTRSLLLYPRCLLQSWYRLPTCNDAPIDKQSEWGVNHPRPKERMASQHRNCTRAVVHAATSAPVSFESTRPRLGAQKSGEFAFAGKSSICFVVMTGEMNRDLATKFSSHFLGIMQASRHSTTTED